MTNLDDDRFEIVTLKIKAGTCVAVPKGTVITLGASPKNTSKQVRLAMDWFVEVDEEVRPSIEVNDNGSK